MLRGLLRAISTMAPTPPTRTVFPAASAKPWTISTVILGGMDRACGSVTSSTSAGPGFDRDRAHDSDSDANLFTGRLVSGFVQAREGLVRAQSFGPSTCSERPSVATATVTGISSTTNS
jgi:hypothetical protein